jgi:tRNA-specific adenosine deaminase 1
VFGTGVSTSGFLCLGAYSNPNYRSTGMKCLPASKIAQSNGVGIHDWHAEVLAIRAFNRFLVDECRNLLIREDESSILQRKGHTSNTDGASLQLFEIKDDIKLHMYCSEAPCKSLSEYNCSSPD